MGWRLDLINSPIPSREGMVTALYVNPCLKENACFCGISCLKQWLDKMYEKGL